MTQFVDSNDFLDFNKKYGSSTQQTNNCSDALWLCSKMLMNCGYELQSSTIILITNNSQPYAPDSHEYQKAFVRAKDLQVQGVHLIVAPMVDDFDDKPFYREFICTVTDEDPNTFKFTPPSEQRENLLNPTLQRNYHRSCLRYFNLILGEGLQISCGFYSFTRDVKLPKSLHLVRETNETVTANMSLVVEEIDEVTNDVVNTKRVLPGDVTKYLNIGGRDITFTPEELSIIKSMMEPSMKLLGFKPLNSLPTNMMVKSTRFVYPNEKEIAGSAILFRALWQKCLAKGKFALCIFSQMRKVAPR